MLDELDELLNSSFLGLSTYESLYYFLPKVLVGTVCGFFVGLERQINERPVGIRTAVLVCVGSSLFTCTAMLLSTAMRATGQLEGFAAPVISDPGRIIAQIVSGVGFIGAGVIFKLNDRIAGITTASLIWAVCALGIIVGLGGYVTSIVLSLGLVVCLVVMQKVEKLAAMRIAKRRAKAREAFEKQTVLQNLSQAEERPKEGHSGAA